MPGFEFIKPNMFLRVLKSWTFIFEVLLLLIQPYPRAVGTLPINFALYTINWAGDANCYIEYSMWLNDLILSAMAFRIYFFVVFLVVMMPTFQKLSTKRIAFEHGVNPNLGFMFRASMVKYNAIVLTVISSAGVLFFAMQVQLWERPYWYHLGRLDFNDYPDAVYFTIITMTSVGYGDMLPNTYFGRGIALAMAIFGAFLLGLVVNVIAVLFDL